MKSTIDLLTEGLDTFDGKMPAGGDFYIELTDSTDRVDTLKSLQRKAASMAKEIVLFINAVDQECRDDVGADAEGADLEGQASRIGRLLLNDAFKAEFGH